MKSRRIAIILGLFILIGILFLISTPAYRLPAYRSPIYRLPAYRLNVSSVGEQSNTVAYDIRSGDATFSGGYNNTQLLAESFKPTKNNLDGVLMYLDRVGTPPDSNITIYIETSSGDFPSGTKLAYSNISIQKMTRGARKWYYFKLNKSVSLSIGTTYHIVYVGSSKDPNNQTKFYYSQRDTYSNGTYEYNFDLGWNSVVLSDVYLKTVTNEKGLFQLRQFPYNYSAVLSISSDIDCSDISSFVHLHDWMNTNKNNTLYGKGLNLDISDSMWFYKKPVTYNYCGGQHQLSYFENLTSTYSVDQPILKRYLDSGYIDSLHSYGDFSRSAPQNITQDEINNAINEWNNNSWSMSVYINHGDANNTQNVGCADYCKGDNSSSSVYHWNRTKNYTWYLWKSDITKSESYLGVPLQVLNDSNGYTANGFPVPLATYTLQDGSKVWYFYRDGTWPNGTLPSLVTKLSSSNLQGLINNNNWSIIYTHFGSGKVPDSGVIRVMNNLSNYSKNGTIWVIPTSKQLKYANVLEFLNWNVTSSGSQIHINIINVTDLIRTWYPKPSELEGVTFYTFDPANTTIWYNGVQLNTTITPNDPDDIYNRSRVTVNISRLIYPSDITDLYANTIKKYRSP